MLFISVNCYPYVYEKPVNRIIDVTNRLTNKILYLKCSGYGNANLVFSPSGLINVLVALYEGSDGKSANEIQSCIGLPWQKELLRSGYRDIHRKLRVIFHLFYSDSDHKLVPVKVHIRIFDRLVE